MVFFLERQFAQLSHVSFFVLVVGSVCLLYSRVSLVSCQSFSVSPKSTATRHAFDLGIFLNAFYLGLILWATHAQT